MLCPSNAVSFVRALFGMVAAMPMHHRRHVVAGNVREWLTIKFKDQRPHNPAQPHHTTDRSEAESPERFSSVLKAHGCYTVYINV